MRLLIDTNLIIAAEPTDAKHAEPGTIAVAELIGLVAAGGHDLLVHPQLVEELSRDRDVARRQVRRALIAKYPLLPRPPIIPARFQDVLGAVSAGSNDYFDRLLLSALEAEAVDVVVTEDARLRKAARRVGLHERTLTVETALELLRALDPQVLPPRAPVDIGFAHQIAADDPLLDSLRVEYDGFDGWLIRCKREGRPVLQVRDAEGRLSAVCIIKDDERAGEYGLPGRLVKLCTFKVSEHHRGRRYGELVLKAFFGWAQHKRFDWAFVEVFENHAETIRLLGSFGFEPLSARSRRGEMVLAKPLRPHEAEGHDLDALNFHIRYGPPAFRFEDVGIFIVPIEPRYHELLFPDAEGQESWLTGHYPFGNSIRKAYLSHSNIRSVEPGSVLLFYRSGPGAGIRCIGVVEEASVFTELHQLERFVLLRTVYPLEELERMFSRPTLAIAFRHATVLDQPISLESLRRARVLKAAPQSITRVSEEGRAWLRTKLLSSP